MNSKLKLLFGAIFAFVVIISTIMMALSVLKDEAVNNYVAISKLNANSYSKELNQDLLNIEQTIINIPPLLELKTSKINKRLFEILKNYPQIRSINLLKDNKILYSSNMHNIGIMLNLNSFYPDTIFDENILKVSSPWVGRDFIEGEDVYKNDELISPKDGFFIPILKKINTSNGIYNVVINLNSEYFINRFLTQIDSSDISFELIRLDGILLLSSKNYKSTGKIISKEEMKILNLTIDKNSYTNIDSLNGRKYILTYILTNNYPIGLAIKLDYEKSLNAWNKKEYDFFLITTLSIILSILIALLFFYKSNKHKEEEIRIHKLQVQSQEKFRLLFQDSHYLASVISSEGDILELNNIALEFLNFKNNEYKNFKIWELECFYDEDKENIKNRILNSDDEKFDNEIVVLDKNFERRYLNFSLSSIVIESEKFFVAMGFDITQIIKREEKLKQAYTVFDNTRDGIMITEKDTTIIDVNKAFENITGFKKEEVIGEKTNILKSNIHSQEFYKIMWNKILDDGFWEGEIVNMTKDKKMFTEWLTIDTIFDTHKNVINFIGVFSDITEQKRKERLLKEKDETLYQQSKMAAMGEMIGNIAHQWRQPLSIISVSATGLLLQKELGLYDEENEKNVLKSINKSTQYLSQTIEDFRNFLNVDKEIKLFSLNEAVKESLSLSNLNNSNMEISIILNLYSNIKVNGIKNEFVQVLMNILKNSKDAFDNKNDMPKYLLIDSYIEQNNIFIKIKDNAGGIPEEIISRIFEPYFTTKHKSQGTGIGLYMSEEIIKNHMKGEISVKNDTYNLNGKVFTGACFTIELPFM